MKKAIKLPIIATIIALLSVLYSFEQKVLSVTSYIKEHNLKEKVSLLIFNEKLNNYNKTIKNTSLELFIYDKDMTYERYKKIIDIKNSIERHFEDTCINNYMANCVKIKTTLIYSKTNLQDMLNEYMKGGYKSEFIESYDKSEYQHEDSNDRLLENVQNAMSDDFKYTSLDKVLSIKDAIFELNSMGISYLLDFNLDFNDIISYEEFAIDTKNMDKSVSLLSNLRRLGFQASLSIETVHDLLKQIKDKLNIEYVDTELIKVYCANAGSWCNVQSIRKLESLDNIVSAYFESHHFVEKSIYDLLDIQISVDDILFLSDK